MKALTEAGLLDYAPLHITLAKHAKRKATRSRPLIPGYVLAHPPPDEAIHQVLAIHGVFEIVSRDGKRIAWWLDFAGAIATSFRSR